MKAAQQLANCPRKCQTTWQNHLLIQLTPTVLTPSTTSWKRRTLPLVICSMTKAHVQIYWKMKELSSTIDSKTWSLLWSRSPCFNLIWRHFWWGVQIFGKSTKMHESWATAGNIWLTLWSSRRNPPKWPFTSLFQLSKTEDTRTAVASPVNTHLPTALL